MPTYIVEVREVWVQPIEVEAETPEEAKRKVWDSLEGVVAEDRFEFSHTQDPGFWTVHEVES